METFRTKPYRTMYPAVKYGKNDDRWHQVNDWHLRPPSDPVHVIYDGFVICFVNEAELYLVNNGTRSIISLTKFHNLGYDIDMVLRFGQKEAAKNIPIGAPML